MANKALGQSPTGVVDWYDMALVPSDVTELEADIVDLETLKAPLASPTFTGTVTVPDGVNPTDAAQFSDVTDEATRAGNAEGLLAPKASPTFTGAVKAAAAAYQAGDKTLVMGADGTIRLSAVDPGS